MQPSFTKRICTKPDVFYAFLAPLQLMQGGCNNYAVVATERAAYVLAITFTKLVRKEKSQFFRFEFVFVRLTEEVSCL